jgi:RNA polymerase sigma-70 factor (ECF subfamily)
MLQIAIEGLPTRFRDIVWLRYTRDLSFGEIGQWLHIPENTAKTYFRRARLLLQSLIINIAGSEECPEGGA